MSMALARKPVGRVRSPNVYVAVNFPSNGSAPKEDSSVRCRQSAKSEGNSRLTTKKAAAARLLSYHNRHCLHATRSLSTKLSFEEAQQEWLASSQRKSNHGSLAATTDSSWVEQDLQPISQLYFDHRTPFQEPLLIVPTIWDGIGVSECRNQTRSQGPSTSYYGEVDSVDFAFAEGDDDFEFDHHLVQDEDLVDTFDE